MTFTAVGIASVIAIAVRFIYKQADRLDHGAIQRQHTSKP